MEFKALTFEKYYQEKNKEISDDKFKQNILKKYFEFVNQPFRVEMLLQLFKGWIVDSNNGFAYEHFSCNSFRPDYYLDFWLNQIEVYYDGNAHIKSYSLYSEGNRYLATYIENKTTLNDFISDCQKCGIELVFKDKFRTYNL